MRYWIGVASREHVRAAVAGGFCQFSHGKAMAVQKLQTGDRIVYYSPRQEMRSGASVQAFTALGEVLKGEPKQVEQEKGFHPHRHRVRYSSVVNTPIRPLIPELSFTRKKTSWGYAFRRGLFQIDEADFQVIEQAMKTG